MGLVKMDIARIVGSKIERTHPRLYDNIKNEGYIKFIKENKDDKDKTKENNLFKTEKNYNNNITFKLCLRYYFNIILRLQRKNTDKKSNPFELFKELIIVYIENDINKAKYILEEFSFKNIIYDYLVFCPNYDSSKDCFEIIIHSLTKIVENKETISNENSILYLFLNTLVIFIANYTKKINIENVNNLFGRIVSLDLKIFTEYLIKKQFHVFIYYYDKNMKQERFNGIFNDRNLPTLKSSHSILNEQIMDNEKTNQNDEDGNNEIDQRFYERLNDSKSNLKLKQELMDLFFTKE
jgi:hypothetical protein